ncbi:MAG TPA: fibronectin type III domain-containing protein, partial [Abditibacteriaceae bacterium]|nr:fibronectin type III domain-containing protein [Abditibacteriaceae bacterium]
RSPQEYYCFSWGGPESGAGDANKLRLWRRQGAQTVVLAERTARARTGQWYRLAVHTLGSRITAYIDENPVLKANDSGLTGGQCGLYVAGDSEAGCGAEFDDVRVQSVESAALARNRRDAADDAGQERDFATDPFMAAWGNAASDWEPSNHSGQNWYWYRGRFFNSLDVRIVSKAPTAGAGRLDLQEVILFSPDDDPAKGYHLNFEPNKVVLRKGGSTLATGTGAIPAELRIIISAGKIRVAGDGRELLHYADAGPLRQGRVAVRFQGPISPATIARAISIKSQSTLEYRFDAAPVDWEIESGVWQSTARWACDPDWNFFGGYGDPIATIWNKRRFAGDQWIEAFIAPREGSSDRMHFTSPVNLNLTFCAEGQKLGSGYSLVYRTHDQSTLFYRAGKLVAENKELVLPGWRADPNFVYDRLSQTWQHFQILKRGGHIQVWIEVPAQGRGRLKRHLLVDYTDPAPLPGDRMALWTWGRNGMSVARVHISAARVQAPSAEFLTLPAAVAQSTAKRSINPINGGSFRTDLVTKPFTAAEFPVIAFDYQSENNTALALYAVAGGQRFRADFLGRVTDDGDSVVMGKVRRAADRTKKGVDWYNATFPLRQALREFFPSGDLPKVEQLFVANLSTSPEQVGGLQVNPRGAVFEWRPPSGASFSTRGAPPNLRLTAAEKNIMPGDDIQIALPDESIDPTDYTVSINKHSLKLGQPGLSWRSTNIQGRQDKLRLLRVNLAAAGLSFNEGEKVGLAVALPDKDGTPATVLSHEWTMRLADDKTPPPPPRIETSFGPDRIDDFETDTGDWQRLGGEQGATLWRDDVRPDDGEHSLRLYHRELSGTFGAVVRDKPFDARRWPLITFSYRLNPEVQLSLVCEFAGKWYELRFTDNDGTYPTIGTIRGVQKDGQWHEAEVDLLSAIQRSGAGTTVISQLFFADTGSMNNLQDIEWHLDNFRFVPALPAGVPHVLQWSARDLSGIEGTSWVLDNSPDTVPDEVAEPDTTGVTVLPDTAYLHVRAKDKAGNWGPPAHFRFASLPAPDAAAAASIASAPAGDKPLAAPSLDVQINQANTIDVESVRWRAKVTNEWKEYDLAGANLQFDANRGLLHWHDSTLTEGTTPTRPYTLTCELQASDLTGKPVLKEQWQWIIDPSLDTTAPPAPFVSYIPANRLCRYDFEKQVPPDVELRRTAWVLHDLKSPAIGQGSARLVNLSGADFFSAFLRKSPYSVTRYPRVAFDYRFEQSGYNLNLVSVVNGDMQIVEFVGRNSGYRPFVQNKIGRVPDVRQDGEWHHAEVDLVDLLRKRYPDASRFYADYFGTWATSPYGMYSNPHGASLWVDNFTIFSPVSTQATFEWQPPVDANGIRGYSHVLDQKPDTLPGEKISTQSTRCEFKDLKPGTWYFHVRACDRAGNWSPATHIAFELVAGPAPSNLNSR